MVEGGVWGGATETVFACDLIVAAETATFAVTPAKLGVPYNVGGMLTFLNATGLRMAKEMTFTAQPIDAARAERHGMINPARSTSVWSPWRSCWWYRPASRGCCGWSRARSDRSHTCGTTSCAIPIRLFACNHRTGAPFANSNCRRRSC